MAKVFLHCVCLDDARIEEWMRGVYNLFAASAVLDRFAAHTLASDPVIADTIASAPLFALSASARPGQRPII